MRNHSHPESGDGRLLLPKLVPMDSILSQVADTPGTTRPRGIRWATLSIAGGVGLLIGWVGYFQPPRDSAAVAKVDNDAISLPRIPPGTVIGDHAPKGWTHLIFKSGSELASGDLDAMPDWSAEMARLLFTAMIARVESARPGGGPPHRLVEAAIGLGTRIGERDVIVSSDTQQSLGAKLGPIKRIVLSRGEERLNGILRVARTDTMVVVDAPQILLSEGRHRSVVFRYVLLVHPGDGRMATVVWRINFGRDGSYLLDPGNAVIIQPNLLTTCAVHVDKREFTAGIPSALAFATTRLPAGRPIALPQAIHSVAGQKHLAASMVRHLEAGIRQAIGFPTP